MTFDPHQPWYLRRRVRLPVVAAVIVAPITAFNWYFGFGTFDSTVNPIVGTLLMWLMIAFSLYMMGY